jgi:hypothetical protein
LSSRNFNQIKRLREYVDSMTGVIRGQAWCAAPVDFQFRAALACSHG